MKLYDIAEPILNNLEVNQTLALYINLAINLIILGAIAYLLDYIFKKILILCLAVVAIRTKSSFDDFLVANKTAKYIAHLVPLYYISKKVPIVLDKFVYWESLFTKLVKFNIIILSILIF